MQQVLAGYWTAAQARLTPVADRLRRTTPRERLLLAGLILGVLIYAPVAASGWRSQAAETYAEAMTERTAARLASDQARRVVAASADAAAVRDMRQWGFEAANVPVAQVRIEQQLLASAQVAELTQMRITTDSEPEAIGPTQWLGAAVEADLRWTTLFAFLDELTAWPQGFRVTRFTYELRPANFGYVDPLAPVLGKVTLGLAFPVRITGAEAPENAS